MPYRRLPNTDVARIKALKTAYSKGKELPPFKLAFSQSTFAKIELFINSFEKAMINYKATYNMQIEKSKDYNVIMKKAKLYLSHFIQVVNMAIARGELPDKTRTIYGMDIDEGKVPSLNTEKDMIEWGKKIIEGEAKRIMSGQQPITNPTIAVVKVRFENFVESYNHQKILQQNTQRMLTELDALRNKADDIILNIWNEVEATFKDLPDDLKRERSSEYGLVYVYRKNELKGLQLLKRSLFEYTNS
ncbi:MAG TPA: hypothetical protein DIW31_06995 [Bacteroidales bacterium]|nr:hypothetical protein [Bacteroidales bacterium]